MEEHWKNTAAGHADNLPDEDIRDDQMPSDYELLELRRAINRTRLAMPDVDKEWEKFRREKVESGSREPEAGHSAPALLRYVLLAAAAAALFFVVSGIRNGRHTGGDVAANQVFTADPGSQQVMLSADDGQMSAVNDRSLAFNRPASGKPTVNHIKMMTLSTPRGKHFSITLPDGTRVWMNADTKIEFPERFAGRERRVAVAGEVYMEVAADKAHPFVVETDYFTTTVLGTVFNLRAHSQHDASLTLISGSVDVSDNEHREHQVLRPSEQLTWSREAGFDVSTVDTYPITQWKDGYFYFNNLPLVNIMQELGRWYNVSVVFENPADMQHQLHFVAERDEPLPDILKRINDLDVVKTSFAGDVITIYHI